jgi:ribosomal protein S17E
MPINPVDINTHLAQNMNLSKVKNAEDMKQLGEARYPDALKEKEEHDKKIVHETSESENKTINNDEKGNSEKQRKKKEKEKKEHNKKMDKLKSLFSGLKDKKSHIDIKL